MATWRGHTITQAFGVKNSSYRLGYHPGTDFRFALGSHQPAFASGIARYQKDKGGGYGNTGTITLPNGDVIFYAHLQENGILVPSGSQVGEGQPVFVTGNTGWITAVHAHIEYRIGGNQDNPVDITKKLGQGGSEMAASADIVTKIYRAVLLREPDVGGLQTYTGRPVDSVFNAIYNSPEANAVRQREQAEDARRNELEGMVRDLQGKIAAMEQATGAERKKLADEVAKLTKDVTEAEAAHKQEVDKLTDQINSLKDQTCEQPVAKKLTVSDHIRGIIEAAVAWFNKK